MTEKQQLLNKYSSKFYFTYTNTIPENEWGNMSTASTYLDKFYLSEIDYTEYWKPIQDSIFQNQDEGLPAKLFDENAFSILALRGGVLFVKEDFEKLQKCAKEIGDRFLIIIQNEFGKKIDGPFFRMKYPIDITWDELMYGNFLSSALFEFFSNEYFVFSESGRWGKYSANDYENPLDIIGFHHDLSTLFELEFSESEEEKKEIFEWLPSEYKKLVRP